MQPRYPRTMKTCLDLKFAADIFISAFFFMLDFVCLILFFTSHQQSFSYVKGRVFLGWTSTKRGLMFLHKDTLQWRRWRSNPLPLGLESSTLPLSHCASLYVCNFFVWILYEIPCLLSHIQDLSSATHLSSAAVLIGAISVNLTLATNDWGHFMGLTLCMLGIF